MQGPVILNLDVQHIWHFAGDHCGLPKPQGRVHCNLLRPRQRASCTSCAAQRRALYARLDISSHASDIDKCSMSFRRGDAT